MCIENRLFFRYFLAFSSVFPRNRLDLFAFFIALIPAAAMLRVNSTDAGAYMSSFSTSLFSDLVSVLSRYAAAMFSLGITYNFKIDMFGTGGCLSCF